MIPNERAFDGKNSFEYNGIIYQRFFYLEKHGDYQLRFRFISVNSQNRQAISLGPSQHPNFIGSIQMDGEELFRAKKKRPQSYLFVQGVFPNDEFILSVHVENGLICICNASDLLGNGIERYGKGAFTIAEYGNAFWVEQLSEGSVRFHCNDHEFDDDFDDLIFDMEIVENCTT